MLTEPIRLRDLPGVQRVNELCRNPNLFDYPQRANTQAEIDAVSIGLFGITQRHTLHEHLQMWIDFESDEGDDELPEIADWERNFAVAMLPYEEALQLWTLLGWDVSDGKGEELLCLHLFARQIILVARELVEGVKFTPEGCGGAGADDVEAAAKRWGETLLRGTRPDIRID